MTKRTHVLCPACPACSQKLSRYGYHRNTRTELLRCDNFECETFGTDTRWGRVHGTTELITRQARKGPPTAEERRAKAKQYRDKSREKKRQLKPAKIKLDPKPTTPPPLKPKKPKAVNPKVGNSQPAAPKPKPTPAPVQRKGISAARLAQLEREEKVLAQRLAGTDAF